MTYKITPRGELVIDKYAPFSPEETKRIFEDLKQLTQMKINGYRMTMPESTMVNFGCMTATVHDINAFYQEYESGSWKAPAWNPENREFILIGTTWTMNHNGNTYMLIGTPEHEKGLIVNLDTGAYRHRVYGGNTHYPATAVDGALHDGSAFTLVKYGAS